MISSLHTPINTLEIFPDISLCYGLINTISRWIKSRKQKQSAPIFFLDTGKKRQMYIVLRRAFSEVRIKLSIYLSISAKGKEEKNKITESAH